MSKLIEKRDEENAIRTAANMVATLQAVEVQLASDAGIITTLEAKIAASPDGKDVTDEDLRNLLDARTRTTHNNARKQTYKAEFPVIKEKIKDKELTDEIDAEIAKL